MTEQSFRGRFRLKGRNLREHTARGTVVNAAYSVGLSVLGLLKGFIVAAFLTAEDYGVWGILVVSLGTLTWLKQAGIGDKYIQQDEEDQELAFQKAFTLELLVTGIFTLLLLALVPVIAIVYGQSEIILPGVVVSLMLIGGVLQTPFWVFYRRMEFMRQRTLQSIDPLVGFVVTVGMAIAGAGYWSFVIGAAAGTWAAGIAALLASPYRLRLRWHGATLREYAGFSWPLMVAGLSGTVIAQGTVLVGEDVKGLAGAGAITLAASVAQFADRVDGIVTTTLYPAICAVRDRIDLQFEAFVKSNRLALMWGIPFGGALALFAQDLVDFGIGEEWQPAVILLQTFGLTQAAGHIGFNWAAFYNAQGRTRPSAVVAVVTMVAFLAVVPALTLSEGLDGLAIGMAIMTLVSLLARGYYLVKLFPAFQMLGHAARAIAPSVPAVLAVVAVRQLDVHRTLGVALAELALYVIVTIAATWLFERRLLVEVLGYLRSRASAQPAPVA